MSQTSGHWKNAAATPNCRPKTQLLAQRVGVIKEDEVGFTVLGISEVAGKQVFGKKHGRADAPL